MQLDHSPFLGVWSTVTRSTLDNQTKWTMDWLDNLAASFDPSSATGTWVDVVHEIIVQSLRRQIEATREAEQAAGTFASLSPQGTFAVHRSWLEPWYELMDKTLETGPENFPLEAADAPSNAP